MRNSRLKTVAIIPAYNEESSIGKVVLRARRYVDNVVVCDDGSTDMTFMLAEALGAKVVSHGEKRGKGEAFRTLSKEVMELNPDIIVTLDGDGQHDADQISALIEPIERGESDMVVGSRYVDGGNMDAPLYRRFGLWVINFLHRKVVGVSTRDTQSGFRAYSRKAFEFLMQCDAKGYGIESEQLVFAARNGLKVTEIPISVKYDVLARNSKKPALLHGAELISTLFRLIIEEKPLTYLGIPGIGLTSIGMILGLYLLWTFNLTRYFNIPVAILAFGTLTTGIFCVIATTVLFGLKRINEKLSKSIKK